MVPSKGTKRERQGFTTPACELVEFSCTHADYRMCFQGSFWVGMLLLSPTLRLLTHPVFIPARPLAAPYLGYCDQQRPTKEQQWGCTPLVKGGEGGAGHEPACSPARAPPPGSPSS